MNDNVTKFPTIVFTCACTCQTFFLHSNGTRECAQCGNTADDEGHWTKNIPVPEDPVVLSDVRSVIAFHDNLDKSFMPKSVIAKINKMVEKDSACLIVGVDKEAGAEFYFDIAGEAQRKWLIRQLQRIIMRVREKKLP